MLEVLAASAIGILLLSALYVSYDIALRSTAAGRDVTGEADLYRAIVNRLNIDLSSPVGLLAPKSGQTNGSSSSSTTTGTTTTTTEATTASTLLPLQSGVIGGGQQLTVFVSRPPKYLTERNIPYDPTTTGSQPPDLTKITYYLHTSGKGLCRQERTWVTADGAWDNADPDRAYEEGDLIAPEVVDASFEFASGSDWISSWDGSQAGVDGASLQGPPRAIRVTLTLELIGPTGQPVQKTLIHVFPIRAAAGPGMPTTTATTTTDPTATGTTGTTGGN
jgi:hypothetical protein